MGGVMAVVVPIPHHPCASTSPQARVNTSTCKQVHRDRSYFFFLIKTSFILYKEKCSPSLSCCPMRQTSFLSHLSPVFL